MYDTSKFADSDVRDFWRCHEFGVRGRKPSVTSFLGKAQNGYNSQDDKETNMDSQDFAWFLLRLNKNGGLLSIIDEINESQQTTPSWSAFHAMVSAICMPRPNIGYCPMIAGSSTEYSTIYTVMKTIQAVTESLGQNDSVVTFDLAIYKKAKEIQWGYPNEFKHLIIRMGGFHIALNFLSAIGKKFQESGIEDLLMESGLYGSSSTVALLKGKTYNRGVRAHKLIMEALLRLQWKAFG